MPRRLALAVLLALGLAGCASQQAAMPGYAWAFMQDPGEGPKLAYGRPSSDEVLLMMTCAATPGRVTLTATGLTGSRLAVSSGGQTARLAATTTPGLGDDSLLQAVTDRDTPVLSNFRRTGDLAILHGDTRHGIAAAPADRGQVKAFFRACEA
ncbi:hypothetical protein ASD79_15575 [Caulobacter sp. Root655]|uniref:hypothetical protein n=1 Tax=Caulobacter sp. Root655 TaxID=1736578 RepID=UPI0007010939|nr:hypothetical protein [Caulobacter sp. Root655]KRA57737.1 hypothetical protein ASD79_15575 [Caulobacter sp. Root655]